MRAVQLPYNIEAEEAVLGAILINDEVMDDIVEFLNTDDFYRRNHRIIFSTMLELHNEQSGIDNLTVVDRLSKKAVRHSRRYCICNSACKYCTNYSKYKSLC